MKSLYESIFDDDDIISDVSIGWLKEHSDIDDNFINKYVTIKNDKLYIADSNEMVTIRCNGEEIPFEFGEVECSLKIFDCASTDGLPSRVKRNFSISFNSKVTHAKGFPKWIGGGFSVDLGDATKISELPEYIGDWFEIRGDKIKKIPTMPKRIKGDICFKSLSELEEIPDIAPEYHLQIFRCPKLKTVGDITYKGKGVLQINRCDKLSNMGAVACNKNVSITIEDCPELRMLPKFSKEASSLILMNLGITSLTGAPEIVHSSVFMRCPKLTTLKGDLKTIHGELTLNNCYELTDADIEDAKKNIKCEKITNW